MRAGVQGLRQSAALQGLILMSVKRGVDSTGRIVSDVIVIVDCACECDWLCVLQLVVERRRRPAGVGVCTWHCNRDCGPAAGRMQRGTCTNLSTDIG